MRLAKLLASIDELAYAGRVLVIFAALAVLEPDGWIKDAQVGTPLAALHLETASYRSPTDPEAKFIAFRVEGRMGPNIDEIVSVLGGSELASISRTHRVDHGVAIDEVVLASADGARLHVRHTLGHWSSRIEMIGGVCFGRGAALAACEERLARISVTPEPGVDTDSVLGLVSTISAALVALALAVFGVRYLLRRRDLAKSQPLVEGELVTIAGVVGMLGTSIEAPLSGTRCVLHRSRAKSFTSGRNRDLLAEAVEAAAVPFVVQTRHGRIFIDERELELPFAPTGLVDRRTPLLDAFRKRHGVDVDAPANFDEIVIAPGAKVTIRGVVKREQDPNAEQGYRDEAPASLRLISLPERPVTVLRVW